MARKLVVYQLQNDQLVEVARLDTEEMLVGREAEGGLSIPSGAISRHHGKFMPIGNHWFFKDLSSTNGTWLNGDKLPPDQPRLLKPGDYIQLADVALQVAEISSGRSLPSMGVRSLLVFSRGEFLEEYPVPEYGRALVIGGPKADLKFDVDLYELPSLVVERRGENVVAFMVAREAVATHNGKEITHTVTLSDRDELKVAQYAVVYNDLEIQPEPAGGDSGEGGAYPQVQSPRVHLDDWETPSTAKPEKLPFGRGMMNNSEDVGETIAIDSEEVEAHMARRESLPGMRYTQEDESSFTFDALEDKIVLVVGILMLLALVVVVSWWVLR